MVKNFGDNGSSLRVAARRLFSRLPGWLQMPTLGRAKEPERTALPDQLSQRDIMKVFYLLLKQGGGKIAMYQETINDVDDGFVKDFVFSQETSLNGLGPGWVIWLKSSEAERTSRIHKRARKQSAKRLKNRKNIKLKTGLPVTAPIKIE